MSNKDIKRRTQMATSAKDTESNSKQPIADYEKEIRAEMAEIRTDLAALTKALGKYGKARVDGLQDDASDLTEEMIAESRRAVKKLGKQVSRLEKDLESNVRENPLQWLLGAMGVGLVITMLMRRNHD
ncbi:DUF883 family protein [Marivita sp.]|uniref:DUF883 family protein n=1 Tax=Marivita sp. TaxID=2003365 RepID=UPI003F4A900E